MVEKGAREIQQQSPNYYASQSIPDPNSLWTVKYLNYSGVSAKSLKP